MIIRPQRKRDKQTKEMLAGLKVGDNVVTIGGIIGTISQIKDDTVTLEVGADRTKIKFERSAIRGIK
jgi:preprotein translocase subunit YajC